MCLLVNMYSAFTGDDVIRVLNDPSHERLQGCFDEAGGVRCTYAFQIEINSEEEDEN